MNKKKDIEVSAKKLFYGRGIVATTVEQICIEAQVSKRTFYKYFSNKTDLAAHILKNFLKQEFEIFEKYKDEAIPFKEKILNTLTDKIKLIEGINEIFFKDIINNEDKLKKILNENIREGEHSFFIFISNEQKNGQIKSFVPASVLSYMLTTKLRDLVYDEGLTKRIPILSERLEFITELFVNGIGQNLKPEE